MHLNCHVYIVFPVKKFSVTLSYCAHLQQCTAQFPHQVQS